MGIEVDSRSISSKGSGYPDYEVNIRELASEDIPQMPLPYDANVALAKNTASALKSVDGGVEWSPTAWGATKSFYPYFITIEIINDAIDIFDNLHYNIYFIENTYLEAISRDFHTVMFSAETNKMIRTKISGTYRWKWTKTIDVRGSKIPVGYNLRLYCWNNTGYDISASGLNSFQFTVVGVAL